MKKSTCCIYAVIILSITGLGIALFLFSLNSSIDSKISYLNNILNLQEQVPISLEYYIRILISAILGFIIGVDRIRKAKPIGLKTYTLISVGSTLITIISTLSVNFFSIEGQTTMDPMRLVAQLLPAVGFVGAGTIYFTNNKVKGLTSAAFVFFAATVGIGIGVGFYGLTIFTYLLIFFFLKTSNRIEKIMNDNGWQEEDEEY